MRTRTRQAIAVARRRKVAALFLRRMTQVEIAARLKIAQSTVSTDLKAVEADWRHEAAASLAEHKARELAELDTIELAAADRFLKTKNLDALRIRLDVKKRRAALLGLDAPKATSITSMPKVLVEYVNSWKDVPRE